MVLPKDRVSCWILCPFFCYNREKRRAQMDEAHVYIAIDLKSFYASVELSLIHISEPTRP